MINNKGTVKNKFNNISIITLCLLESEAHAKALRALEQCTVPIDVHILVRLLFEGDANHITFHGSHGGLATPAGHFEKII